MWRLHVLGKNVKYTTIRTDGYYDIAVQGSLVYAVRRYHANTVDVYDSSTWHQLQEIPSPCCSAKAHSDHTLQVSNDRILLCCWNINKLFVLSHSGELLQTHGRSSREATEDNITGILASDEQVYSSGKLRDPYLCQVDAEGSALVADYGHHRLQVMRADGTWSVVHLDRTVIYTKVAVWCNGSLYAANHYKIVRFS